MKRGSATKASSKPSSVTTTEEELLKVIGSQSGMTGIWENAASLIKSQDWTALLGTLQGNPVLSHVPLVSSLIKEVLGPISEAQGIAKAVIGVVASVVDMYLNAKANTVKCQKLGRQLGDVEPSLNYLLAALNNKTSAILASTPLGAAQMAQFKRETDSLKKPLQTLQMTAKAVQATISEWAAKGTRLFGTVRQMLQAKSYYLIFAEHSADISNSMQSLQVALAAMTFLNVNDVQQQLQKLPNKAIVSKSMEDAIRQDEKEFSGQIKALIERDEEFKQELEKHWDEVSADMRSQFGDLHTYLDSQFHKVIGKIEGMHKDVIVIHGVARDVSDLHEKMDEVLRQNRGGSGKLMLAIDAGGVIEKIDGLIKIIRSFNKDDAKSGITRVLRDVPMSLTRCRDLVESIDSLNIRTAYCAVTLKHFAQDLDSSAIVLKKWLLKSSSFRAKDAMFWNSARLSRLQDLMAGLKDFQDNLMQALHQTEEGLSEARKGTFHNYEVIVSENARKFWIINFPGRAEVPLGEFTSVLRWQSFLVDLDDTCRTRVFYWLKCALDEDGNQLIDIGEWNRFTAKCDFTVMIPSLARKRVPDEDEIDGNGESRSPSVARAAGPALRDDEKRSNPLTRMPRELKDEDLRSVGIHSVASSAACGIDSIDIGLLVDCTSTMGAHIAKLCEHLPSLVKGLQRNFPGAAVRVAFVGYRDIGDKEPLCVYPFTERVDSVLKFIKRDGEATGGGGDAAEDVFSGLSRAASLEWSFGKKTVRRLVHVADAPSHGTRYHTFAERTKAPSWKDSQHRWDRFPEFDSDGGKGRQLMITLARKKIDYTFVQVFTFTEKMTDQFKKWYDDCPGKNLPMDVIPLTKIEELSTTVAKVVQVSVSSLK